MYELAILYATTLHIFYSPISFPIFFDTYGLNLFQKKVIKIF